MWTCQCCFFQNSDDTQQYCQCGASRIQEERIPQEQSFSYNQEKRASKLYETNPGMGRSNNASSYVSSQTAMISDSDLGLEIEPKSRLVAGKSSPLCFHIHNKSAMDYDRVIIEVNIGSQDNIKLKKTLPCPLGAFQSQKCSIFYKASTKLTAEVITKVNIYLYKNNKIYGVFCSYDEIRLDITDPAISGSPTNVYMRDYSQLIGDINIGTSTSQIQPIPIKLKYSPKDTKKIKLASRQLSVELPKEEPCSSLCLEFSNDKTKRIYLIGKQEVIIGRSSKCDIQAYFIDKKDKLNKELCSFISRFHAKIIYRADRIMIKDMRNKTGNNYIILNKENYLKVPGELHQIADNDVITIGNLEIKATLFPNHNRYSVISTADREAQDLYNQPHLLWQNYGGYNKPGNYSCLKLNYLNNPHLKREYILTYKYAEFGSCAKLPIPINDVIPQITGQFRFENNRFYVEKLSNEFKQFFVNGNEVGIGEAVMLRDGAEIVIGDVRIKVKGKS